MSLFCMLVRLEIAPSKMVARECYADKNEYQDILVFTLRGEAAAIPIMTDHNMQQTTYDTLLTKVPWYTCETGSFMAGSI